MWDWVGGPLTGTSQDRGPGNEITYFKNYQFFSIYSVVDSIEHCIRTD